MGKIVIFRNGSAHLNLVERGKVTITDGTFNRAMLSDDSVTLKVNSSSVLDIKVNDYFTLFGENYRINQLPTFTKNSNSSYEYQIVAQGLMYDLLRCKFFNADGEGFKTTLDFPLIGNLELFLTVIANNMKRFSDKWEFKSYPFQKGETKTLTFGSDTCLSALQKICQEFKTDFWVKSENGKFVIHTGDFGNTIPVTFEYGKGNGLYALSRSNVNEEGVINRMYVEGSSENLPNNYRNFSDRLKFSDAGYLEDANLIAEMGLKEGELKLDDIYPSRTGKVTSLGVTKFKFIDNTMDFDLNEKEADGITTKYLKPDTTAKIHFNTGNLAGYEFEIKKGGYKHATKEFEIIPITTSSGQKIPDLTSGAFQFAVGDEYVLIDIYAPEIYITNAENKLLAKATEQFALKKQVKVSYELTVDPEYIKNLQTKINVGDYVRVKDAKLGVDKVIRVNSISQNFIKGGEWQENDYKITIADTYEISYASQMILDVREIKNVNNITNQGEINYSLIGMKSTRELQSMVFDTDGYFDPINIKPNSIETNMLTVGSQSQQLSCSVVFRVNADGLKNKIVSESGKLFSQTFNKTWDIPALTFNVPDDVARYVYVKCSKTGTAGSVLYDSAQRKFDEDPNDFYFLVGILHSVVEGMRVLSITIGTTTINGGLIRTGIISSLDGETTFNLNTGGFKGKFTFANGTNVQTAVENAQNTANGSVKTVDVEYYLSNSATVLSGGTWVTIAPEWVNGKYMWSRTKTTLVNGNITYTPSANGVCIAGAEGTSGVGISSITERYLASDLANGVTASTSGWTTTIQTISPTKKYLWNYKTTTYTNGSTSQTTPVIIGTYGDKGLDGVPGQNGANGQPTYTWIRYADTPTSGISNVPTNKAYIGLAYNKLTPTESNVYSDYKWSLIKGADGVRGADGVDGQPTYTWIKYSDVSDGSNPYDIPTDNTRYIGIATNKLTPTESANKADYIWSKFKGDNGVGISSIVEYYLASASPSGITINTAGWTSTVQTIDTTKKYLWNYTKTTYTNGTVENTNPVLIGTMGANGSNGQGITSITENYYLSTSKTMQIGGEWTNTPPTWMPNTYLWTRSTIVWNNPTATTTTPPIVDSSWEAVNNIQIGGRNLWLDSSVEITRNNTEPTILRNLSSIVKAETEYCFSFDMIYVDGGGYVVKVAFDGGVGETGFNITNGNWNRYVVKLKTSSSSNISFHQLYFWLQGGTGTVKIKNIKLEKGNKATDWSPAPEDVDASITVANANSATALAQAQNAQASAAAAASVTSFMQTTVDGNVVSTGTLQVGSATGANAGITGVVDRGGDSVRFYAGSNYAGKDSSAWSVSDNGLHRFHHPNGVLGLEIGVKNGEIVINGYHETGFKTYEMSPNRGLVNVTYIPESFSMQKSMYFGTTYNETNIKNAILGIITDTLIDYGVNSIPGRRYNRQWKIKTELLENVFLYSAGTHPNNEQYKELAGYKANSFNRFQNAQNGWYYFNHIQIIASGWDDFGVYEASAYFGMYRLQDGKVVENKTINTQVYASN